ncbi:anthocyanidin 3-O-glucosyltransferase 2-like [Panicum virgatum]|uniref:Glycosyltransferase n=1 Tax=Panicum virgatum TaxID=38727 RepID=A0A8T0PV04_PANVG|nr:anthocyanidin 3-O-glucosyltransferase 2-like [Panicum virgatum]KAG2564309.1 hypothetical protein PVAP13_8KG398800 [Panicum virgatum]
MATANPTVVLVPVWGVGHFLPMIEAGKRLLAAASRGGRPLTLTVLIMPAPTAKRASEIAEHIRDMEQDQASANLGIRFLYLPAAPPPAPAAGAGASYSGPEEFISLSMQQYTPHVRAAIAGLTCPVAAVVVDLFCTPLLDAARDLGVPAYVYLICSAAMCALLLRAPALDDELSAGGGAGEDAQFEADVHVPGLPAPVPPSCLPTGLADRTVPAYDWFVYNGRRYTEAAGLIVNTVAEVEPRVLAAIADGRCTRGVRPPPVYTVGPVLADFTSPEQEQGEEHECVRWLHAQPPRSVVFLCFGSSRHLTAEQAGEAAVALERSGRRFLWVLRGPPAPGEKLTSDGDHLAAMLPAGFLERTARRGMVWPRWAPQREILAHAAVGGFVTHCGWNSALESLAAGVPMVPWPWAAEQHYNAFVLAAGGVGAAVRVEVDRGRDSFVEAAELERAIGSLFGDGEEGRKARETAMEMKVACRTAVEEGGSSTASLRRLCDALHRGAVAVLPDPAGQ